MIEITEDDYTNIMKWVTATSMMVEAKLRTPFSDSERKTMDKITQSYNVTKLKEVSE